MFREDVFRVALAEMNKTQKQVARECGVHELTITKIKQGAEPKIKLAMKIAKAVNKTVYDLWSPDE